MACEWYHFFIGMLMLVFGVISIIIGILGIYFSSGKTRIAFSVVIIIGLIVFILFLWSSWCLPLLGTPPIQLCGCITKGFSALIGGVIGFLISIGIILGIIMKM